MVDSLLTAKTLSQLERLAHDLTQGLLHVVEDGADDSSDYAPFDRVFRGLAGEIPLDRVRQSGDGQGLEPDAAGAGQRGQEDSVAAEDHVLDAGDGGDLKCDAGLECADVAGMDAQGFAGLQVADNEFAREFEPGSALSADLLQQEAVAAENSGAQGLLEADADLNLRRGAEEALTVNHVFVAGRDFDGHDVAGEFRGEREFAGVADGAIFGHKNGATAGYALEHSEDASAAAELGVRGHLDRTAHPGEFSGFGDDAFVRFEGKFQNGHGGAGDAALHGESPQ